MDQIDKKTEETLRALDGIRPAHAPDALWDKTLRRIARAQKRIVPLRTVLRAAAVFIGIVLLNAISLRRTLETNNAGNAPIQVQALAKDYFEVSNGMNY
jgi:hypothetical protein